jgi:hypothetical protein
MTRNALRPLATCQPRGATVVAIAAKEHSGGVAVMTPDISHAEFDALHEVGVHGRHGAVAVPCCLKTLARSAPRLRTH